jgi:hypothetical protein
MSLVGRIWPTALFFDLRADWRAAAAFLWLEFKLARPAILGVPLDAVAHGLRTVDSVPVARLPRMADFALRATACETALWPPGTFGPRLRGKPQSRDRKHHRSRSRSQLRACNHGRPEHLDRERVRPFAFVCGAYSR